ncbi:nucleotidyltransferase family protein [Allopontixanthobacter sediminis]|uniref:Uncharacterized protein n=1 Tax=Allopontixanthobacter sediminis TaxID=1689985 RepID=A0A845B4A8_9SPHN|nr:hypothetical protein [Allopontixanthobacter sediminis]
MDWTPVLALANRTLVTPALAAALQGKPGVPTGVHVFLTHIAARTTERNVLMKRQLVEAVQALSNGGVTPILIKGAAFLATCQPVSVNRLSTDLDLVIPADAAEISWGILQSIGYRAQAPSAARGAGLSFERDSDVGEVDIHYCLRSFENWPTYDVLEPFCIRTELAGAAILMPSASLHAAILIAHDQLQERDYWRGLIDLRHLVDLREFVAGAGSLDSATLDAFFFTGRSRRALKTQLRTLEQLLPLAPLRNLEGSAWARLQCNRRFWQIGRPQMMHLLTAATLLLDPPILTRRMRPLEERRERAQYLKRMFSAKKPNKV